MKGPLLFFLCHQAWCNMDAYVRTGTLKPDHEKPQPNEIRVTAQGKMRKYILYATNLLDVCRF